MGGTRKAMGLLLIFGLSLAATVNQNTKALSSSNTEFAINLYKEVISLAKGENVFMSPISISMALGMVYAGAKGNTKQQMAKVLRFQGALQDSAVHGSFKNLLDIFNDPTKNYTLSLANRLFVAKDLTLLDKFLQDTKKNYYAGAKVLDFEAKADASRIYINEWVANKTYEKIKDLLPQGTITSSTVLVLVNCIYFKALWKLRFDKASTKASKFYPISGSPVNMDMMNLKQKYFKYGTVDALNSKILELPYEGDQISMFILLPNEKNGLTSLEGKITRSILDTAIKSMEVKPIDLTLPKFKLTQTINLKKLLTKMGMSDLFSASLADLSGIFGNKKNAVTEVIHKSFAQVDEEGTEAAAATAVIISRTSLVIPISFRADRPFIFFIREKDTGSILFFGRITKPTASDGEPTIGSFSGGPTNDAGCIKPAPVVLILTCTLMLLKVVVRQL